MTKNSARFILPATTDGSLGHERHVVDLFTRLQTALLDMRDFFFPQEDGKLIKSPNDKKQSSWQTQGGISVGRTPSTKAYRLTYKEKPENISAHQTVLLAALHQAVEQNFVGFEQALLRVPAFHHASVSPCVKLRKFAVRDKYPSRIVNLVLYNDSRDIYHSDGARRLATLLMSYRGLEVSPNDPLWRVGTISIPAPDADTALLFFRLATTPKESIRDKYVPIPVSLESDLLDRNTRSINAANARLFPQESKP